MEMDGDNWPCGENGGKHGGKHGGEYGGVIPTREDEEMGGEETIMKGYETKR